IERCRHIDASDLDAALVGSAGSNVADPKREATQIGLPIEEIEVVLGHEEIRVSKGISSIGRFVVGNRNRGRGLRTQSSSCWISQADGEILGALSIRVID